MDEYLGIEILNDDETTMEAVVGMLHDTLAIPEDAAFERMLQIHNEGRCIVYMGSAVDQEVALKKIDVWKRTNGCSVAYHSTGPHSKEDYAVWFSKLNSDRLANLTMAKIQGTVIGIAVGLSASTILLWLFQKFLSFLEQ